MMVSSTSCWKTLFVSITFVGCCSAFLSSPSRQQRAGISLKAEGDGFFSSIPKLPSFPGSSTSSSRISGSSSVDETSNAGAFEATSIGLIRQARRLLASDFGILDPALLDDSDFVWIGPFVDEPLGKLEYLAAGRFFDLRAAFPDLDYRPHDFRIDEMDPYTIRITCRVTGTMRGALRLRDGTLAPTGKRMKCPPEAVTITFNPFGKVTKLCTGFCLDRQVGNTKGATGVMAAALVAGQPPSDWDLYPAPAVVKRFFGRPIEPLQETKSVLAPFPETVMIQLTKGILATNMAANDPSLLADNFEFSTPYFGPIRKSEFIDKYALEEFENVDPSFSHFRVDPYDPVRVWVDVVPKGSGYQGAPQAMSFSFDEDGFCVRITSSFVMDPSIGNGGGLGGSEGYRYALGKGTPELLTRPWARVIGRVRKQVLSPLTGVGVDDYRTSAQAKQASPTSFNADGTVEPKMLKSKPMESLSAIKATVAPPAPPAAPPVMPQPLKREPLVVSELDRQKEINRREAEAAKEAAALKMKGAEEAKLLMAEMEAAEKRAMEARAKLEKLEADRIARDKQMTEQAVAALAKQKTEAQKAAQAKQEAEAQKAAAAAAAAQKEQKQVQLSALEKAKAIAAEAAEATAKRAKALEEARIAAANRLKGVEVTKQTQAEERQRRLEQQKAEAEKKKAEAAAQRAAALEEKQKKLDEQKAAAEKKRAEAAAQRAAALEAKQQEIAQRKAEAEKNMADIKAAAEAKKAAAVKKTQKLLESKEAAKQAAMAKKEAEEEAKARAERQKAALDSLTNAVNRATISLFGGFGGATDVTGVPSRPSRSIPVAPRPSRPIPVPPPRPSRSIPIPRPSRSIPIPRPSRSIPIPIAVTGPPRGVPVIKRWRKTASGAISGRISGSKSFADGELITTSPIAEGTVASGQVVKTGSGSRYFLE